MALALFEVCLKDKEGKSYVKHFVARNWVEAKEEGERQFPNRKATSSSFVRYE